MHGEAKGRGGLMHDEEAKGGAMGILEDSRRGAVSGYKGKNRETCGMGTTRS